VNYTSLLTILFGGGAVKLQRAAVLMLALCAIAPIGCSRGKAVAKAVPADSSSSKSAEPKAPAAPPEPELVPGEPISLKLPTEAGQWPWSIGKADAFHDYRPISFPNLPQYAITGFAVRPEVHRAVASIKWEKKGQPTGTRLVLCDTSSGKVLSEWQIAGLQAVLDLSPDGRAILSTYALPGRDRNTLRLWLVGSDGQLRRTAWTPHSPARPDGFRQEPGERTDPATAQEIRWAGFVGNDRIASSSRTGQMRIFDADGAKPLTSIEGSPGRPAITPDGTKIALLVGSAIALLDPYAGAILGTHAIGSLPPHPALSFSPDGSKLAIGGNGKATLIELTSGNVQQLVLPKLHVTDTGLFDKPFGWAGNDYLFADGRLHDLRFPGSVWDYTGVEQVRFKGSRIWACVRPGNGTSYTLSAFDLPQPLTKMYVAFAADRSGAFALKTGDAIRIDASGVPENRRSEVQTALENRLKALHYRPDPAAAAVLFASVDATGNKVAASYSGYDTYSYMRTPAVLRLVVNGKDVWSDSWAVEPPFSIRLPVGVLLPDHLKQFNVGEPNYSLFSNAPIPPSIPGPQAPSAPFGTGELNAERSKT
jgi:hypothetical protein